MAGYRLFVVVARHDGDILLYATWRAALIIISAAAP